MTSLVRVPTLAGPILLGLTLGSVAVAAGLIAGGARADSQAPPLETVDQSDAPSESPITVTLGAPLAPRFSEPVSLSVETMGTIPSDGAVRGCPGFIQASERGVAQGGLMVEAARAIGDLYIHIDGADIAAAIIEGPDGIHHCAVADDNGLISHRFDALGNGRVHIRPANTDPGIVTAARVVLSDTALVPNDLVAYSPGTFGPPRHGRIALSADADRRRQHLAAATVRVSEPASTLDSACPGYVDPDAADIVLTLDDQQDNLSLFAESHEDLVLMVLDPSGLWHCDDDSYGFNPAVTVSPAEAGAYRIHVGGYSRDITGDFDLFANLGVPRWRYSTGQPYDGDAGLATGILGFDAAPSGGRLYLEPGIVTDRAPIRLVNRTGIAAEISPDCAGYMDPSRPDTVLTLDRVEPRVTVYAASEADTTLMLRTPDGGILCNDDFVGLNPGIVMTDAEPGDYAIWVGSYDGFPAEATVGATRGIPDWVEVRHASSTQPGALRSGLKTDNDLIVHPSSRVGQRNDLTQLFALGTGGTIE